MGVKLGSNRALLAGAVLLLGACGGGGGGAPPAPLDEEDGSTPRFDSGVRRDGGADAGRDGGTDAGDGGGMDGGDSGSGDGGADAGFNPLGPVLELLYPGMPDSPGATDVIVGSTLSVRCRASKNAKGELVNPASVKVALYPSSSATAFVTQVATSTSETDVFKADVSLAAAPHGSIRVECSADDVAQTKQHSAVSVDVQYDSGPKITLLYPSTNSFVAAGDGEGEDVRVRFKVEPQPLNDGDDGADVTNIHVTVGGKDFLAIDESPTEPYVYSFGLDFNDKTMFSVVPDTLDVLVTATDSRTPLPATSRARLENVGIDSEGPTITMVKPTSVGALPPVVSGKVDVILEVKDTLAGVNENSVRIVIGTPSGTTKTYSTTPQANSRFAMSFQTNEYPSISRLALTLIAEDRAGNETTVGRNIDVDTVPPWISLDPPNVREQNTKKNPSECSATFDPLGDAVNDGVVTAQAFRPRAVIWDRPLFVSGQSSVRYAMIDDTTPQLFVQHNVGEPLLIDSDQDGLCDSINAAPQDESKRPTAVQLSSVKPQGPVPRAYYVAPGNVLTSDFAFEPAPASGQCVPAGGAADPPLCQDTVMTHITKHTAEGTNPVVYASNPSAGGIGCTGIDYLSTHPGWACLVVQAKDNAGNLGFSLPLRVCNAFDSPDDPDTNIDGNCPGNPGETVPVPPEITCTDGCTMPDWFTASPVGQDKAMPRFITLFE
jgi:hypothetical protein